jgi:hypothetical protein
VRRRFQIKRKFEDNKPKSVNNLVRLGAMDSAELLERARHYRSLADRADGEIREELLDLAEQYEMWARERERGGQDPMDHLLPNRPQHAKGNVMAEDPLSQAERHVFEGERRIAEQIARIAHIGTRSLSAQQ